MNRFDLIAQSVRIKAVENAMAHAAERIRIRREGQHRFGGGGAGQNSPMAKARSGS